MNNTQKDTLIQLYQISAAAKYRELNDFRDEIDIVPLKSNKQPYTAAKRKVYTYQAIFAVIGVMFFILAEMVSMTTLSYPLLFGAGAYFTARNLLVGFSLLAGVGSFVSALLMTPGREAASQIHSQARCHLRKHKQRKKMEWNLVKYFRWKFCKKTHLLRDAYQDAEEKLVEAYEEALHLLARIRKSSLDKNEAETLFNQALLEYGDKGRSIVREFRKTQPPAAQPVGP